MSFDPSSISSIALVLLAWGAAFLAALWLSLVIWTARDIRRRARDPLARILAVLVVAVLFLPGIVVYLILRPPRTLEEEYQQTLEEEALLQTIEDSTLCPGCGRRVKENWVICPNCHTRLKKRCHNCSKLMELPWNLCPYCGTPAPGMRRENLTLNEALQPVIVESGDENGSGEEGFPAEPGPELNPAVADLGSQPAESETLSAGLQDSTEADSETPETKLASSD